MSVKIDQALTQRFISGNFGLPIAHENTQYTPTAGAAYAEIKVFGNDVTPFSFAHSDETDGFLQIILRYPLDTGAIAAKTKADEILAAYRIGTRLMYDGQRVTITRNQRMDGREEGGWYQIVLRVFYAAIMSR